MRWLSAQGTRLTQPQGAVGAASQTPWALFSFGEGARPKNRGLRGPQGNWTLSASNSLIATAAGLGLKNGTSVGGAVFADVRAFDGVSPANSPLWYMVTFVHGAYVNQGSGINLVFQYGSPDSNAGIYLRVNSANVLTAVVANTALTGPTLVAGRAYAVVAGRDASGACWLWVNGAKVASGTGATAALSAQASALYLSGGEGTNRAFQGVVNAFAMGSESPSEFGASISANPWQLFEPERRIWVPVVVGGGSNGNASAAPSALSLVAVAAGASGDGNASAAPVALVLGAAQAGASGAAQAGAAPTALALAAAEGAATGDASATAAPTALALTPAEASASGTTSGAGDAFGALAALALTAPLGQATGNGLAAGAASAVSLTAATATADGTEAVNPAVPAGLNFSTVNGFALNGAPPLLTGGQAYGAPAGLTLVASNATAAGTATASGALAALTLVAPQAAATGAANAQSAPHAITLVAPTATANGLTALVDEPDLVRPPLDGRLLYRPPLDARAIDRPPLESRLIVRVAPETELRKAA